MKNTHATHSAMPKAHDMHDDPMTFGIWTYIMSDCVLFASLFAAYAVLQSGTASGPLPHEIFDRSFVLIETLVLLTSSFTCGMMLIAAQRRHSGATWLALVATCAFGATFIGMELHEFSALAASGHSWQQSAFLSSYFALVGTHGLHVAVGLIWLISLGLHLLVSGVSPANARRLGYFALFWHFLDIVWIFIFSFVYLFGSM